MTYSYKKILLDLVKNGIASIIVLSTLQFIIFPSIAKSVGKNVFGDILFYLAIIYVLNATFATSLSNLRLRNHGRPGAENDYITLIILGVITALIIYITISLSLSTSPVFYYLFFYLILLTIRTYFSVYLRISLDYTKYLLLNIFLVTTYLLLFFISYVLVMKDYWIFIFIFSELVAIIYLYKNLNLSLNFNPSVNSTRLLLSYLFLGFIGVLEASNNYLDRFLLKSIIDSEQVSTFFVVTVLSKLQPFIVTMLAGVFLSYLSRAEYKQLRAKFLQLNITIYLLVGVMFFAVYFANPIVIKFLYPSYPEILSNDHLLLASNIAFMLLSIEMFLKPILIKFVKLQYIIYKELLFLSILILLGYFFIKEYGLLGYCYSIILVSILKIFFSYYIILNENIRLSQQI